MADTACYAQNPAVELHGEDPYGGVLLNPQTGGVRGLNATGVFIWHLCDGSRDVQAVVEALCQTFEDVPEDLVRDQTVAFLEVLLAGGFVDLVGA